MDERQLAVIVTEQSTTAAAGTDMSYHNHERRSPLFIAPSATATPMNGVA